MATELYVMFGRDLALTLTPVAGGRFQRERAYLLGDQAEPTRPEGGIDERQRGGRCLLLKLRLLNLGSEGGLVDEPVHGPPERLAPVPVQFLQRGREIRAEYSVECVALFGSIQRKVQNAPIAAELKYFAHGTSISMPNNAAPNVLPCASTRSDTVPPPPSAWSSRKFNAPRFGSS